MKDFNRRVEFLQDSGQTQIRLIGGEPTLHPQFLKIIDCIISKNLKAIVFSNGNFPESILSHLEIIPPEKLALLINVNAQCSEPNSKSQRLEVFRSLGNRVTLGFTILNPIFDLSEFYQSINVFDLQRKLRLGLAQPILFGNNRFLSPKLYKTAAESIMINAAKAKKQDIQLEFDCGFVRCMFTEQEWEQLDNFDIVSKCHCAPNLDIDLDGQIFHCFSLSQITTSLNDHNKTNQAYARLSNQRKLFRESGIYPHCSECPERTNGYCSGGCLSITMMRYHGISPEFLNNFYDNAKTDA